MAGSIQRRAESKTLSELIALLRQHLPELRERFGVRELWLFGSYVRDEQRKRSDLDVLVEFEERPLTLLQFIALENYLSDLLEIKVDLVEKGALKPGISRHVLEEVQRV